MSTDLDPLFKRLHLANARRVWRDLVRRAELEEWSYEQLLTTLISEEVAHRRGTRLHRAVRSAQLPFLRTIEEFDFSYQSTLRLTTFGSLLSPDFVTEGHSVILEGKPGRGKTHLAISIAYRAMQNGFEALFVNCAELIDDLSCASRRGELREALMRYLKPHVLVVDEVGYLAYGDDAANVLFHVVNERHIKKRAMVFTTNKSPKRWGPVLHDDDLAEAIVDRILDRGRLLRLDGPSLRTKHLAGDTSLDDDQDGTGDRRVSGTNTAEFPEPTVRACDVANAVASVASAIGATEQAPLPVSRERTTTWSRLRAWDAADAEARIGLGARLHGRGARTSPRSCRVHSRERLRASPRHVAGRPCSAASHRLRAWHRASRDRAIRPSCDGLTITACVAHTSRARAPNLGRASREGSGRTEGRGAMRESWWFAHATWRTPWRVSRLPSARRSRRHCPCRVSARPRGRGFAPRTQQTPGLVSASARDCTVVGPRTSPRSCREHSRERLRASPRHVAGRPCSTA
jgi:DNA replication protein DnaC